VAVHPSFVLPSTYYVDASNTSGPWYGTEDYPFQYIQDAIEVCYRAEQILVAPGLYVENVDYLGKDVSILSTRGPDFTTIDGNQTSSAVVTFQSDNGHGSMLDGFTVTNGGGGTPGGIYCEYNSSPLIRNNIIVGNTAWNGGGILCANSSSPTITKNMILRNTALTDGGGIYCEDAAIVTNNVIADNVATNRGGGVFFEETTATVTNNTITGNSSGQGGGGIYCYYNTSVVATNTIFWNNDAPQGAEIYIDSTSTLTISYSDIDGMQASIYIKPGGTIIPGDGLIDADPRFANPSLDDYHLGSDSLCFNAGDNTAPALPRADFEGGPRIYPIGHKVDMGADEIHWLMEQPPASAGGIVPAGPAPGRQRTP